MAQTGVPEVLQSANGATKHKLEEILQCVPIVQEK